MFETCVTFAEARTVLERTPLARPTLFTLTGTLSGERLVIEREETAFRTLVADRAVANAWRTPRPGWQSRVCGTGTPEANNATRIAELSIFANDTARAFAWACPPVVNVFTRLTVEMSAARGTLDAMG